MKDTLPRILLVLEEGSECEPHLLVIATEVLRFQFVSGVSPSGLSAWTAEDNNLFKVSKRCKPLAGGFDQQALNRIIGQMILRHQVELLVVLGVTGVTIDLPRVAAMLSVPTVWIADRMTAADDITQQWLNDAQRHAITLPAAATKVVIEQAVNQADHRAGKEITQRQFDYASYEFCQRDHPLLMQMQTGETSHFLGCKQVLDLGCGAGIFLELLRRCGVNAMGVERDTVIAEYGRGMGLDIVTDDALDFLRTGAQLFDGIYCSHFVEHLPFEAVRDLISLLAARLDAGGVLVLTFPDPESIRSQLLGFWRDPEHVRFYHPELIRGLAEAVGLVCEWTSYDDQPHDIISFAEQPPAINIQAITGLETGVTKRSWCARMMARLGWQSMKEQQAWQTQINEKLIQQDQIISQLTERTETLWSVNKTWAWNDNVTLRLRKR